MTEEDDLDSGIAELLGETGEQPKFKLNKDATVAVSTTQYWEPIDTCPRGVKVQLLGGGGVAVYGVYNGFYFWTHWAPVPATRKESNAQTQTPRTPSATRSPFDGYPARRLQPPRRCHVAAQAPRTPALVPCSQAAAQRQHSQGSCRRRRPCRTGAEVQPAPVDHQGDSAVSGATDFSLWSQENLASFARDADLLLRQQRNDIATLLAEVRRLVIALDESKERQHGSTDR